MIIAHFAFIKQKELTAINTVEKVDHKTARILFNAYYAKHHTPWNQTYKPNMVAVQDKKKLISFRISFIFKN